MANDFLEMLAADVSGAYSEGKQVYLLGDYNINLMDSSEANKLETFANNLDLTIFNYKVPTRVTAQSATLIDQFLSSTPDAVQCYVTETNVPTDHCLSTYVTSYKRRKSNGFLIPHAQQEELLKRKNLSRSATGKLVRYLSATKSRRYAL